MRRYLYFLAIGLMFSCLQNESNKAVVATDIDQLVSDMTLEEKVHMLHGSGKFTSAGVERLGVPALTSTDGPLGVREEIQNDSWAAAGWDNDFATFFPAGGGLSATWNLELAEKYGVAIAKKPEQETNMYCWRLQLTLLGHLLEVETLNTLQRTLF